MPRSLFGRPSNRSYKAAVAQIIRDVKARNRLSNERLAELIGCSETTVFNAENETCDLAAVTLLNIAYAFGESAIAPVRALYLCSPTEEPSRAERLRRIIGEAELILKEEE
jgi:DNA-binding XRE family transcriptional regulator